MLADYIIWQYRTGPVWLITFFWRGQRVLLHSFSVPLMVRTLLAHWHHDAVSYRLAGIGSIALAFAWNQISRAIGFLIRFTVLLLWVMAATVYAGVGIAAVLIFLLWPLLIALFFIGGIALLIQG